jgi:electron-transferring-flavoprotein dehydrogenase
VGAGPAGLSAAIRLKQLNPEYEVYVIEKGSEVGAHILSGNVFEPRALDELLPAWRSSASPIKTRVSEDQFFVLTENSGYEVPQSLVPGFLHNEGNFVVSLSEVVRWLGSQAEDLGVNILSGFSAAGLVENEGKVEGIYTNDFGIDKQGKKKESFQPGVEIRAKQTFLAEGCRGSLSQKVIKKNGLDKGKDVQTYGLGIKEVWKIPERMLRPGLVFHSVLWPLDSGTQGGGFMYHEVDGSVHVGLIVGLDYKNPYLSPFKEFQRYKTHPFLKKYLQDGECIAYGARTVNKGGFAAVPKMTFPGGLLLGCGAGLLNPAKIKGTHTAMKSGILAAEAFHESQTTEELHQFTEKYEKSWIYEELFSVRGISKGLSSGLWSGMVNAFFSYNFLSGGSVLNPIKTSDSLKTESKFNHSEINYEKPDGKLTFDILTSVSRTGTNHEHDQPVHLKIKPGLESLPSESFSKYAGPESRFCPAGVYEFSEGQLTINAQNCIHCKTCDIKTPGEYIEWTVPEGTGGPF